MQLGKTKFATPLDPVLEKINLDPFVARVSQKVWPGALLIVVATLLAYWPVYSAGFIWDDDDYVINDQNLHDAHGMREIWLNPEASQQYYPLVYTTFWLEYHLWGLNPHGFHVVNVVLQAVAALLLWRVLACLKLPGTWLAAAIFALHPVQVESVAWVTERKNVLCAVFYFSAALAYLRFAKLEEGESPNPHRWRAYGLALLLFIAALSSKTVACSLPASLLLVFWWKNGWLLRRDVLPLVPFFAVGLALGLTTAWLEKNHVGATGPDFALTFADRCLVAGRALWFYATNLIFPDNLMFVYPRWNIDARVFWQWLYPAAFLGAVAGLWLGRHRVGRGPLVAVLVFAGTLAPALGFINVYPMRFSFVADHFQYLACVGLVVLAAAWLVRLPSVINGGLLLLLGLLTCHQCTGYHDLETLWLITLKKNPDCWMAHTNLGRLLVQQGKFDEAEAHYRTALTIDPNMEDIHYNYANLLARTGRLAEAETQYDQAMALDPAKADILNNLGALLLKQHRPAEAIVQYQQAIALRPEIMSYHYNLGSALAGEHQADAAVAEFKRALELEPDSDLVKRRLRALGVTVN